MIYRKRRPKHAQVEQERQHFLQVFSEPMIPRELSPEEQELLVELEQASAPFVPIPPDEPPIPGAQTVRFSQMSAEAEREMAEWDAILRGES